MPHSPYPVLFGCTLPPDFARVSPAGIGTPFDKSLGLFVEGTTVAVPSEEVTTLYPFASATLASNPVTIKVAFVVSGVAA